MKDKKIIGSLLAMLGVASILFLVGFSNVNQQFNLTEKMAPVAEKIEEIHKFITRKKFHDISGRETSLENKDMVVLKEYIASLPQEHPLDVPLVNQMEAPRLIYGCEVASLAMLLQYQGIDVSKNQLATEIAKVPLVYDNGLKGNPNEGFVGDMANGPGHSVWHKPIHDLAQKYVGDRAIDITGSKPEEIYKYLDQRLPVWIIITSTLAPVDDFKTWNTPQGQIKMTSKSHSVAVTGYTDEYVYVNDPYGEKNKKVDRALFEEAWKQMGSQAIVITK